MTSLFAQLSVSILIFPSHKKTARFQIEVLRSGKSACSAPKSGRRHPTTRQSKYMCVLYISGIEQSMTSVILPVSRINGQCSDNQYILYYDIRSAGAWLGRSSFKSCGVGNNFLFGKKGMLYSGRYLFVQYMHDQSTTNEPFRIRIICSSYNRLPADILLSVSLGLYRTGWGICIIS